MNGKILQFFKDHWFGIVSFVVVCAAICCGIYSCTRGISVDLHAKGNRINISTSK